MSDVLVDLRVMEAVQMSLGAERDAARERLAEIWPSLDSSDAFHRCIVAHYMADLQTDASAELEWDRLALEAALSGSHDAFNGRIPGVEYAAFLPSLHLNLAASHERVGDLGAAKRQAAVALHAIGVLGSTPLDELTRAAVQRLCERLNLNPSTSA